MVKSKSKSIEEVSSVLHRSMQFLLWDRRVIDGKDEMDRRLQSERLLDARIHIHHSIFPYCI